MFEKLLQKILKDVLGEFIEGIDTNKLNIGVWSGSVEIVNVSLKPKLLATLGLPFRIIYSNISRLNVVIPWKNLFSAPLVIDIDTVLMLAENSGYTLTPEEQASTYLLRVKQFIQKMAREIATTSKPQDKPASYLDTVYLKMLDNLYLTARNIHLRFEASKPPQTQEPAFERFSFGIGVNLLEVYAVDEKQQKVFIDRTKLPKQKCQIRKKVEVKMGVYWNSKEQGACFGLDDIQNPTKSKLSERQSYYRRMLDLEKGVNKIKYFLDLTCHGLITEEVIKQKVAKYSIRVELEDIQTDIHESMLQNTLKFVNSVDLGKQNKRKSSINQIDWDKPEGMELKISLEKFCVNEFWGAQSASNPKNYPPLASEELKKLKMLLFDYRDSMDIILKKVKEILLGDLGSKKNLSKSEIISNWHKLEGILQQQGQRSQNQFEIDLKFLVQRLLLRYRNSKKQRVLSLHLATNSLIFQKSLANQTLVDAQIHEITLLGVKDTQLLKLEKIQEKIGTFAIDLTMKGLSNGETAAKLSIGRNTITYDFPTIAEIDKLKNTLVPIIPQTEEAERNSTNSRKKSLQPVSDNSQNRKPSEKLINSQGKMTIKIELAEIDCVIPLEDHLYSCFAIKSSQIKLQQSSSVQSQYCKTIEMTFTGINLSSWQRNVYFAYMILPFNLNLFVGQTRQIESQEKSKSIKKRVKVQVEEIKLKVEGQTVKNMAKLVSSLTSLKKKNALDLSSLTGQVLLLQDEAWKKYDGVIVNQNLYLYEKDLQFCSQCLKVLSAQKIKVKKRDTLQVATSEGCIKMIVRDQEEMEAWLNKLTQIGQKNQAYDVLKKSLFKSDQQQQTTFLSTLEVILGFQKLTLQVPSLHFQASIQGIKVFSLYKGEKKGLICSGEELSVQLASTNLILLKGSQKGQTCIEMGVYQQNKTVVEVKIIEQLQVFMRPKALLAIMQQVQNMSKSSTLFNPIKMESEDTKIVQGLSQQQNGLQLSISTSGHSASIEPMVKILFFNLLWEGTAFENSPILKAEITSLNVILEREVKLKVTGISLYERLSEGMKDTQGEKNTENAKQKEDPFSECFLRSWQKSNNSILLTLGKDMKVQVENIYFPEYEHYITMRAVDYFLTQVKQLLLSPSTFRGFSHEQNQRTHSRYYLLQKFLNNQLKASEIQNRISSCTLMEIAVENTYIRLKNRNEINSPAVTVMCAKINVKNGKENAYNVSIDQEIPLQVYEIIFEGLNVLGEFQRSLVSEKMTFRRRLSTRTKKLQDLCSLRKGGRVWLLDQEQPQILCIKVMMMGSHPQYLALYPQFEHDGQVKVEVNLGDVKLSPICEPIDAILLSKCFNCILSNIGFEDGLNKEFCYDQAIKNYQVENPHPKRSDPSQILESLPSYLQVHVKANNIACKVTPIRRESATDLQKQCQPLEVYLSGLGVTYSTKDSHPRTELELDGINIHFGEGEIVSSNGKMSEWIRETILMGFQKNKMKEEESESPQKLPRGAIKKSKIFRLIIEKKQMDEQIKEEKGDPVQKEVKNEEANQFPEKTKSEEKIKPTPIKLKKQMSLFLERLSINYDPNLLDQYQGFLGGLRYLNDISRENSILEQAVRPEQPSNNFVEESTITANFTDIFLRACLNQERTPPFLIILFDAEFEDLENKHTKVSVPFLQVYLQGSEEEQIEASSLVNRDKKSILQPTSLQYSKKFKASAQKNFQSDSLESEEKLSIQKCFIKISLNDLKPLATCLTKISSQMSAIQSDQYKFHNHSKKFNSEIRIKDSIDLDRSYGGHKQHRSFEALNESVHSHRKPRARKQIDFIFQPIELVMVNQINKSLSPLIYANVDIVLFDEKSVKLNTYINYFNLRINSWEPLLEPCAIQVSLLPHIAIQKIYRVERVAHQKQQGKQEQEKVEERDKNRNTEKDREMERDKEGSQSNSDYMNVNISTNLIESMLPTLTNASPSQQNLRARQFSGTGGSNDEINCTVILNQLGYRIVIHTYAKTMVKSFSISNGRSKKVSFLNEQNNWDLEGDELDIGSQSSLLQSRKKSIQRRKDLIQLQINNQFSIKDIDVTEIGIKKLNFERNGESQSIYKHIYMDISRNVKYIKLYSEVMIKNQTKLKLNLRDHSAETIPSAVHPLNSQQHLEESSMKSEVRKRTESVESISKIERSMSKVEGKQDEKTHKGQICSLCLALSPEKETFLAYDDLREIQTLNQGQLQALIMGEHSTDTHQQHLQQSYIEEHAFRFIIKKKKRKFRTIFNILPSCKFINKLPQSLNLALKAEDKILYWFTLSRDDTRQLYRPFQNLEISIHADGYQWSDFYPCKSTSQLLIKDFGGNKIRASLAVSSDEDGVPIIILYPHLVLRNDCTSTIFVRDPEALKSTEPIKIQSGEQKSLCNNRILIFGVWGSQEYKKVVLSQEQFTCKFPLKPALLGEQLHNQYKNCLGLYEEVNLSHNLLKTLHPTENEKISTRLLTVSNRTFFCNLTSHTLIIRKYNRRDLFNSRVFEPGDRRPFHMFEQDYQNQSYFQIGLKNTDYQWSGALSFTATASASFDFLLRNRSDCEDKLFFNLTVIKFNKMEKYQLELRECSEEEIPFVIRNQLEDFTISIPEFGNICIEEGEETYFSWDQPILKGGSITILLETEVKGKKVTARHIIKTEEISEKEQLIKIKNSPVIPECSLTHGRFTKFYTIREYKEAARETEQLKLQLNLPLRIALINNSFTPVTHLLDFTTKLSLKQNQMSEGSAFNFALKDVQVDNHTKYRVYFPVVLSTSLYANIYSGENIQIEINVDPVTLNLQEDFGKELYATYMLLEAFLEKDKRNLDRREVQSEQKNLEISQRQRLSSSTVFISKLKLPEIKIFLQVKTNKLSIQTTVKLDKPITTKYPWTTFPYPVSKIAINLLSHLSISPWSVISSFHRGVTSLLTEQQAIRGFEGFFSQIIAGVTNSLSGIIGMIVGHDIQRVDHFFDGVEQGSGLLWHQLSEIKDCFEPEECTLPAVMKSLGYGAFALVFKPVKGILQMTLKISQGIKKTAQFSFQAHSKAFRNRDRIVFYGLGEKFMNYDPLQSRYLSYLNRADGENVKYFHVVSFYRVEDKVSNKSSLLCVGTDQVLLVDLLKFKVVWDVSLTGNLSISLKHFTVINLGGGLQSVDMINQDVANELMKQLKALQSKLIVRS